MGRLLWSASGTIVARIRAFFTPVFDGLWSDSVNRLAELLPWSRNCQTERLAAQ
jgi:hypothetical protein